MPEFPPKPIPAEEFLERFVPAAFAEVDLPADAKDTDVKLGVVLEGTGGGEWIFHLRDGVLSVEAGSRAEAAFTLVISVDDFRGALWEGRGGIFGRVSTALFRPGEAPEATAGFGLGQGPLSPAVLAQLGTLDALVLLILTGGEGGDWSARFKLGPGEIPADPTTTVTIAAEDLAAMESGELDPIQAFMGGRIRVDGDMTIVMQLQAAQLQSQEPGSSSS